MFLHEGQAGRSNALFRLQQEPGREFRPLVEDAVPNSSREKFVWPSYDLHLYQQEYVRQANWATNKGGGPSAQREPGLTRAASKEGARP